MLQYVDLSKNDGGNAFIWKSNAIVNDGVSIGVTSTYNPTGKHDGTVYKHSMLGVNVLTNRMVRIADRKLKFAHDKPRLSGRDYQPYVKTNRRDMFATVGTPDARLIDAEYEKHGQTADKVLDKLNVAYKARKDAKGKDITDLGVLTVYMDLALRLLVSGSNFDATCHAIADSMVQAFKSDSLAVNIDLPENNSRSRDGKLTNGDTKRFNAYDAAIVWISAKGAEIVKIAIARLDKALEVYQR